MTFDRNTLENFPTQPGVYLMKGKLGKIIYVGKAKNLRQRVRQYFLPSGDGRTIIPYLIAKVAIIDTIVVASEKEALLLENTLIKQHQPHYNALLKDDKAYVGLRINEQHRWPKLSLVHYKGIPKDKCTYFGPYTSADAARQTLELLQRIFPLRQCSDQELIRRTRPCILYEMNRCIAPCVNKCTKEEYLGLVQNTVQFLRGKDKEVLKTLYADMEEASLALNFEKAANTLKIIRQLEKTIEGQRVDRIQGTTNADALAIFREGDEVVLTQLMFREGKLIGSSYYEFTGIAENDVELYESFILQHYEKNEAPHEILLPISLENQDSLSEILSENRHQVHLHTPQRGEKKSLVEMALVNAGATFKKEKDATFLREKILTEMQGRFRLTRYPHLIECFDNSNIAGTLVVSSLVAFCDGQKDTSRYRKYKIRGNVGSDDYAAMSEALTRHFRQRKNTGDLPDLLVVDGGKGHLNVALKVLADLEIISIDVIGLAKEEGRHDRGTTIEQVFLPNVKDPILLKQNSPVLFLLQQIRDEAHRTAISFHRQLHLKKTTHSAVEDIEGIGPVKSKALLKHFGSLKGLIKASEEDLKSVSCLSSSNIQAIIAFQIKSKT